MSDIPDHFMRDADGYHRSMAWQASERAEAGDITPDSERPNRSLEQMPCPACAGTGTKVSLSVGLGTVSRCGPCLGSKTVPVGTRFRCRTDDRPESWWDHPDQDGLWDEDYSLVEEELEVHQGIGSTNPRIEREWPE